MTFKINSLYLTDSYKVGHKAMLAEGTTKLYATWIPRSFKHAPEGINKVVSFGQQLVWKWLHDEFEENFFRTNDRDQGYLEDEDAKEMALQFINDISLHIGMPFDGKHFEELWDLGYLPIRVKSLPEGIETLENIPHMTFVNTVDGFAWLTLYLETIVSSLAWKPSTSATIARQYKKVATEWIRKTDPTNMWLVDYICHDFSARGLNPHDMISSGLGHATSFRGSDTLPVIPAARYYYNEPDDKVCINSVVASEHSVSTTKIFTVGEQQMLSDWMKLFPNGILSVVSDTFDLWKLITEYLPANKDIIMNRDGKLVIRPDSGDPVDIICGTGTEKWHIRTVDKGVIELLWDIFGGTINEQGYKVLDSHIGCIYGDSITLDRQLEIYKRLEAKGFATTNIVLGIGSYTYQYNTRDSFGFAAKGSWFEVKKPNNCKCQKEGINPLTETFCCDNYHDNPPDWCLLNNINVGKKTSYNIYKDPVTDDGTKKSLKGLQMVFLNEIGEYSVKSECSEEEEKTGFLRVIYEDGKFYNQTSLAEIRERLDNENI